MSNEKENKAIVRRLFEDAWTKGELSVPSEIVADDIIVHSLLEHLADFPPGSEGSRREAALYWAALPDLVMRVVPQVAEADKGRDSLDWARYPSYDLTWSTAYRVGR